ncbi:hypothetical protein EHE19_015390 [Ruminiclostridium herbifermentans]|uniref:Uncharacterized protein n=1 Tax=Ruminiclostridium herbifermentans TaxID=2488810 RepID=A0A4U7JHS5_9FIRM|nr:hypothetical protein [Ruminiclostridium herbifermentans]QNU66250.1 hypothetical protein EHE19_015390 [Ruminiclostridium herbifermentans]
MIREVSDEKIVKEGFYQAFYKEENFEILLSKINKGVLLDAHKHEHEQFGFCFWGKFNFIVENTSYDIEKNTSYLIDKNLEHSANSDEDFFALDFKYIDKDKVKISPLSSIISGKKIKINDVTLGKHKLFRVMSQEEAASITIDKSSNFDFFLVTEKQIAIWNAGKEINLYPMKIYKLEGCTNEDFDLRINNPDEEMLIIQISRRET